jgi:hypothetical protein
MIFKCLDRAFSGVDTVIVGFNEQEVALLRCEEAFDLFACLIIHDIQFYREPSAREEIKLLLVGSEYCGVLHVWDWEAEDCIRLVMVDNEEAHVAFERHVREVSRQVAVHYASLFVGKRAEAEHVAGERCVVVLDDVGIWGLGNALSGGRGVGGV